MIYRLNTKEDPALSDEGGKAKAHIETTHAGFPVPAGFVLTAGFFDSWLRTMKDSESWKNMLKSPSKEHCDALKQVADTLVFTEEQKELIEKEIGHLSPEALFAVRSSSPEEDLNEFSFAGIFDSILGVPPG